jgi:phospholipase/carboxylesterase
MEPATAILLLLGGAVAFGGKKRRSHRQCPTIGTGGNMAGLNFIEDISGGANPNARLPLIIFLHSRGATPEGAHAMENRIKIPARILTPQGPVSIGGAYGWYSARAKDEDQDNLARQMFESGKQVASFISDAMHCFPTVGKPIVTGSSQGACMAFLIASLYPRLVSGAVGVSGWVPQSLWNKNMAPAYALHGTNDNTVPYGPTAQWAELMDQVELWSYPGVGHGVNKDMARDWTQALTYFIESATLAA